MWIPNPYTEYSPSSASPVVEKIPVVDKTLPPDNVYLAKAPRQENGTQEKTPFCGTLFHNLSHSVLTAQSCCKC